MRLQKSCLHWVEKPLEIIWNFLTSKSSFHSSSSIHLSFAIKRKLSLISRETLASPPHKTPHTSGKCSLDKDNNQCPPTLYKTPTWELCSNLIIIIFVKPHYTQTHTHNLALTSENIQALDNYVCCACRTGRVWEGLDYEVNCRLLITNQKNTKIRMQRKIAKKSRNILNNGSDRKEKEQRRSKREENDGRKGNSRWISFAAVSHQPEIHLPMLLLLLVHFLPDQIGMFSSSHLSNDVSWRWLRLTNTGFLNFVDSMTSILAW